MPREYFDDIDTPIDESLLSGDDDGQATDPEALSRIAGEEADLGSGGDGQDDAAGDDAAPGPGADDAGAVGAGAAPASGEAPAQPDPEPQVKRDTQIPRERFDEVNARRKEAEDRARELEARLAALELAQKQQAPAAPQQPEVDLTQPQIDLEAKEREYLEATYTGETDKAVAIRKEIQAEERRIAREIQQAAVAEAERRAVERVRQDSEQASLKAVAAKALEQYPFLNDNNGANPVMDEVVELRDFYAFKGDSPAVALQKAIDRVAPAHVKQVAPPAPAPAPKVDPRPAAAVARNAADAKAQAPAPEAGIGNRVAPPEPSIDTQADWEKLPAAERERLLQGA